MANPFGAPEISVQAVARMCADSQRKFLWLDVREPNEHALVRIADDRIHLVPLSQIAARRLDALPDVAQVTDAEIVVMCHHGVRSAQVVAWLQQQGWSNVFNLTGGIDAWAKEIDPAIGTY